MIGHGNGSAARGGAAITRHRRLDERGLALPMAMIFLGLLTMLMLAFGVLGQSEGLIASNHMLMTQARANAESGVEHALWGLNACVKEDPPPAGCLEKPLPNPMTAPYDGSAFVDPSATGGYLLLVSGLPDEGRRIRARGCVPNCQAPRAQRIVQTDALWLPPIALPEAPFMGKGTVNIGGTAMIDGRPICPGRPPGVGLVAGDAVNPDADWGAAKIYGAEGDTANPNQEGVDYVQNAPDDRFTDVTLSDQALDHYRQLAKQNGTYFGPGSPNGTPAESPGWTGEVLFNSSNKLKDGVVFIDTVSGQNIPEAMDQQNPDDFANVVIQGNPFVGKDNDGVFHGTLIVNGSLQISGGMKMQAVVYTVNDFVYNGTGDGRIEGAVITQNIRDTETTIAEVDALLDGNSRIVRKCDLDTPWGFVVNAGTYREVEGDTL